MENLKNSIYRNIEVIQILIVLGMISLMQGCSTAKVRVMPSEDGIHHVVSKDIEKEGAEEAAMERAQEYCEKQGKQMFVVREEKTNYQGSMNEDTRKTVRNASKAAMIVGGPAGVLSRSAGTGGIISGAGVVGYSMTNDRDYEAQFTFRCK